MTLHGGQKCATRKIRRTLCGLVGQARDFKQRWILCIDKRFHLAVSYEDVTCSRCLAARRPDSENVRVGELPKC